MFAQVARSLDPLRWFKQGEPPDTTAIDSGLYDLELLGQYQYGVVYW